MLELPLSCGSSCYKQWHRKVWEGRMSRKTINPVLAISYEHLQESMVQPAVCSIPLLASPLPWEAERDVKDDVFTSA